MYFDDSVDALSLVISDDLFTSNWRVHSLERMSGYSFIHFDQHRKNRKDIIPKAVFTINFEKSGYKDMMIIFIPIFAAIFLSLFTFLMSFNNAKGKLALSLTAITALLSYRFVIQQLMPAIRYFTITDKIYLFFLILAFLIFIFQLLLIRQYMLYSERQKIAVEDLLASDVSALVPKRTEKINSFLYFVSIGLFVIALTYFLLF